MSRFSQEYGFIPLFEPKDAAGGAYVSDAFNVSLFNSLSLYISFGAITGDSTVLTVYNDATSALATALTTAIAFSYKVSLASYKATTAGPAAADQFGAATAVTSTGLTLVSATFAHKTIVIELDLDSLGSVNHWVAVNTTASANPLLMSGWGIARSRYAGSLIPSSLT